MSVHKGYAFQLYIVIFRPAIEELMRFANKRVPLDPRGVTRVNC
jgi:hypothetical protein